MDIIQGFFCNVLKSEVPDEAVLSYLMESLSEEADEDIIDSVQCMLESVSTTFAAIPEVQKTPLVLQLYQQVQESKASRSDQQADMQQPSTSAIPQDLNNTISLNSQQQNISEEAVTARTASNADESMIDQLLELCNQPVSREFLAYVLQDQHGLQGAVEWLLDAIDNNRSLDCYETEWRAAQHQAALQERQQSYEEARLKQQVLARFDLQPVVPSKAGRGAKQQDKALWQAVAGHNTAASKVRYRDGQAVSHKGEKFIVEQLKEDWDGGSRGKVYTKGKRGKGFH